jgi:hypothetical protein
MGSSKIGTYLRDVAEATRLSQILRDTVESKDVYDTYDKFVNYSAVVDEPRNFYADALHVRFIARMEYVKFAPEEYEFASTQYVFFKITGEHEERTDIVVRFQLPNVVFVGGERMELHTARGPDHDAIMRMRSLISADLLAYVVEKLERWA